MDRRFHDNEAGNGAVGLLAHAGRLSPGPDVWSARAGRVDHGTVVEVSLRLEQGVIAEAAYLAFGDGNVYVCADTACRMLVGRSAAMARELSGLDLAAAADLPHEALGCAMVVEDALKHVLAQI
jgi:NifU-like protein involved in Fe-S cluster formation